MTRANAPVPEAFDVAVIGGGINGCGIARDLQGRGASVVLFEQGDLAGATSSASTKLIHGGLRYLEHYDFRLVREALQERERLWSLAPHIIWPLRFVLPVHDSPRPVAMLRAGLFLYDHIGGRKRLPPTRTLDLTRDPAGVGLAAGTKIGFEYSDCWVQDARLVVLNAMDAAERGARIRVRTRVTALERSAHAWSITAQSAAGISTTSARILINAAGPWVGEVAALGRVSARHRVRLVRGSHIVVPRLFAHERAYIFQGRDGRVVFSIPYEQDFTLVGTTDVDHHGAPEPVAATPEEIEYLCRTISPYLDRPVRPDQVVWSYAGVRPLIDDGSGRPEETTRDYVLDLDADGGAPAVSVFGGKITTYRRLAESVVKLLRGKTPAADRPSWSGEAALPGGDFPKECFDVLVDRFSARNPWAERPFLHRLARAYGVRASEILDGVTREAELGQAFGAGLFAREVDYLIQREWARTAEDILWRRSKLGLRLTAHETEQLEKYLRKLVDAVGIEPTTPPV